MAHSNVNRRGFLATVAAMSGGLIADRALATIVRSTSLPALARAQVQRLGPAITRVDRVAIADFAAPSSAVRFHLIDMTSGAIDSFLVAHGRGSDPAHSGWLQRFSNESGSACTSEGAYRTLDYYDGAHGRSMRLAGLDRTNSNAQERAIVIHSAKYVSRDIAQGGGVLGRSEGCFAVAETDLRQVLAMLGPGRLVLAGRFAG